MSNRAEETSAKTCATCGATPEDRQRSMPAEPQVLRTCRHCGADKCCICDMGDDVTCMSCENDE